VKDRSVSTLVFAPTHASSDICINSHRGVHYSCRYLSHIDLSCYHCYVHTLLK